MTSIESGRLNRRFVEEIGPKQGETVFDKSVPGRVGSLIPETQIPHTELPPAEFLRGSLSLPEMSEPGVVRHYTGLSRLNFSIGTGMYPLGSCTMKYNPRVNEEIAALEGFAHAHPEQPVETIQGSLEVLHGLQTYLSEITGMYAATLSPMGGAQGELTGVLMIKAFHEKNGEGERRRRILVPDSAHGTNPATASMAGYEVTEVKSGKDGNVDMDDFRSKMGHDVGGAMFTQPNTLGLFEENIFEIADSLHKSGALLYGDGANTNAIMGKAKHADMGFDVMHLNTHKSLTTPHGGGGPGAGPVMVVKDLVPFLPGPIVVRDSETGLYRFETPKDSIGKVSGWYGNVAVLLRAYSYIRTMGAQGLREVSEQAVLSANYVKAGIKDDYEIQYGEGRRNMHEVVVNGNLLGSHSNTDTAKRLIDYGFHPPTMSFPLIAEGALMIEPTETEGIQELDRLIAVMKIIAQEAREEPDLLRNAPHFTPVGRVNEVKAARNPILRWQPKS